MRIATVILLVPVFALAQASPEPPSPPAVPLSPAPSEAPAPAATPSTPVPPAPPPASTASAPRPSWSVGAGLASGDYLFPFIRASQLGPVLVAYVNPMPVVTASLERRLGDRTWLSVGASGSVNRTRNDPSAGYVSLTRDDGAQVYVTAGVRRAITAAAPVEVSVLVLGEAGYAMSNQRWVGATPSHQEQSAWLAGASLGLAVDRELASGLALRVATPLAGLSWTRTRTDVETQMSHGSDFAARVIVAPRLELRLAF